MESVFIEVEKSIFGTSSNLVIGVIYRMPDSSVEIFNDRMNDWLNIIQREKKICYFLGDLNLDLLRNEKHRPTSAFLDILYSYNVYPLISKPTRVTANSATLIDHILTNNFDVQCKHKQGILCNSITDHYAVFHITNGSGTVAEQSEFILKRDYRYNNILKFKENLAKIQWDRILNEQNAQIAYNAFCNIFTQEYDKCFPIKKHSKKYCIKKPWLTSALKESMKIKNKLYVSRNRGNETERRIFHYKTYRNKLHHLLRAAERQYYQDLLTEHKSNLKKSWQVIKMIINKRKCNLFSPTLAFPRSAVQGWHACPHGLVYTGCPTRPQTLLLWPARSGLPKSPHAARGSQPEAGNEHAWHWRTKSFISLSFLLVLHTSLSSIYITLHIFQVHTKCILYGIINYLIWFEDGYRILQLLMRITKNKCLSCICHTETCDSELSFHESEQTVPAVNAISSDFLCMNF